MVGKSSHTHTLDIPNTENWLLGSVYQPLPPTLHLKSQEDRDCTLAWDIRQILKSSSVAGQSNMHLSLLLSVFDWFYILCRSDHSLILLLKKYYIIVQRKLIRTGKNLKERIGFSNKVIQTELQDIKISPVSSLD